MGLLVLCALVVFGVIRIRKNPHKIGRDSRFYGSHTGGAWLILASIATIVITLFVYRGAQINTGTFPYRQRCVRVGVGRLAARSAR